METKNIKGKRALDTVMEKMFSYVREDYKDDYCTRENWYLDHTWTEQQQSEFRDWFVEEFYNNFSEYKQMYDYLPKNKTSITKAVNWFILNYGWKVEKKDN